MIRDGWGEENGYFVHLESEMCIEQREDGHWYAVDVDDRERSYPFDSPVQGMDWVDREYADNPRHALEW